MPTDWDANYRAGDTPWDKGRPAPPLLEWLEQPGHRFSDAVLVPGCGLGHDVRAIAAIGQATTVCGLDSSPAALTRARRFPPNVGESYVLADLFALPAAMRGRFAWVFEHTCFCAIHPSSRPDYVRAMADVLMTGGNLLAIFYLTPWRDREAPPEGGPPFATSRTELDALFGGHFRVLNEYVPTQSYPGREGCELVRLLCKVG